MALGNAPLLKAMLRPSPLGPASPYKHFHSHPFSPHPIPLPATAMHLRALLPLRQLKSSELNPNQQTVNQLNSSQLNSSQSNYMQLNSSQLNSNHLSSNQLSSSQLTSGQPIKPRALRLRGLLAGISLTLLALVLPQSLPGAKPGPWLAAAQAQAQASKDQPLLRIGAIPDQNPEKLNRLYGLVAAALERQLGVKVKYLPVTDYAAAVTAFRTGDLDLVWFGGLTGVQAKLQKPGAKMLAQRDIDAQFYSVFIANTASGIQPIRSQQGLKSLQGKRFTFGSESSTSGRLMPQYFLQQAGLKLKDFAGGAPGFSGSHDATIALVQSGAYDAGAVNEQVWKTSLRNGKVNRAKVIQIWRTPPYPDYLWLAQPNLDQRFGPGFTTKLQKVIIGWRPSDPQQKTILGLFGAQQFTVVNPALYTQIEKVGREIGKIR